MCTFSLRLQRRWLKGRGADDLAGACRAVGGGAVAGDGVAEDAVVALSGRNRRQTVHRHVHDLATSSSSVRMRVVAH